MSTGLILHGEVVDRRDEMIAELQEQVANLNMALSQARLDLDRERQASAVAVRELRRQLNPLYQALRALFGEIEAVAGATEAAAPSAKSQAVWDAWKQRLGGSCAKVIDALMLHGDLNTQQLAVTTGLHRTTIPTLIHKLNKNGLIDKSAGRFSLKKL